MNRKKNELKHGYVEVVIFLRKCAGCTVRSSSSKRGRTDMMRQIIKDSVFHAKKFLLSSEKKITKYFLSKKKF